MIACERDKEFRKLLNTLYSACVHLRSLSSWKDAQYMNFDIYICVSSGNCANRAECVRRNKINRALLWRVLCPQSSSHIIYYDFCYINTIESLQIQLEIILELCEIENKYLDLPSVEQHELYRLTLFPFWIRYHYNKFPLEFSLYFSFRYSIFGQKWNLK